MRKFCHLLLATLCTALTAAAQSDWSSVKSLPSGAKVTVQTTNGDVQAGLVEAATDEAIRITRRGQSITIAKDDARRITDRSRHKRLRNALIGAAVGVGIGAVLDATLGTYGRNEGRPEWRTTIYLSTIGIGTGIGTLIPSHPLIYRK